MEFNIVTISLGRAAAALRKTVNIGTFNEDQFLIKFQEHIHYMMNFANKIRNVRKELKYTLLTTKKVLRQYVKVKNARRNTVPTTKVSKYSCTQTTILLPNTGNS